LSSQLVFDFVKLTRLKPQRLLLMVDILCCSDDLEHQGFTESVPLTQTAGIESLTMLLVFPRSILEFLSRYQSSARDGLLVLSAAHHLVGATWQLSVLAAC
jgi:hypothetical protein